MGTACNLNSRHVLRAMLPMLIAMAGCVDIQVTPNEQFDRPGGDGAPCDVDSDCLHDKCMPSRNEFGSGICFSVYWVGCVAITEPVPLAPLCQAELKPYVCGDYDATLLGQCQPRGIGDLGEIYYCCTTS